MFPANSLIKIFFSQFLNYIRFYFIMPVILINCLLIAIMFISFLGFFNLNLPFRLIEILLSLIGKESIRTTRVDHIVVIYSLIVLTVDVLWNLVKKLFHLELRFSSKRKLLLIVIFITSALFISFTSPIWGKDESIKKTILISATILIANIYAFSINLIFSKIKDGIIKIESKWTSQLPRN